MIDRRSFLTLMGAATARSANAGPMMCGATSGGAGDCLYKGANHDQYKDAKKFSPIAAAECIPRRTWSHVSVQEKGDITRAFKTAYFAMSARPNLSGLNGQGWSHQYYCGLFKVHCSSAFLLWHRAFLYFHERLLFGSTSQARLVAWDWENSTDVPDIFGDASLAGSWVDQCIPKCSPGSYVRGRITTPITPALIQSWLSGNDTDFVGGPDPKDLESEPHAFGAPHSLVHSQLGSYMGDPNTAALDPLFYAHHANVDRYFDAWWKYQRAKNPNFTPEWPAKDWHFCDIGGQVVVNPKDCADFFMDTANLGYTYEKPATVALFESDDLTVKTNSDGTLFLYNDSLQLFLDRISVLLNWLPGVISFAPGKLLEGVAKALAGRSFPAVISLRVTGIRARGHYLLGLQDRSTGLVHEIGGFGTFGHLHHRWFRGSDWSANEPLSIPVNLLPDIFAGKRRLVWGSRLKLNNPLRDQTIRIRYPKTMAGFQALLK